MIFSKKARTDSTPKGYSERLYRFYNRAAGDRWDAVREVMEAWFSRLDEDVQRMMVKRFQGDDDQFQAAWWELYLHESLLRMGFTVDYEPERDNGSRPDFLATHSLGHFYLEATTAQVSVKTSDADRRIAVIHDALNAIDLPIFLDMNVLSSSPTSPSVNRLNKAIADWATTLDIAALTSLWERGEFRRVPQFTYQDRAWALHFRAIPRYRNRSPNPRRRPIGTYNYRGVEMRRRGDLARRVEAKANHYGQLDRPLIVAVHALNPFIDAEEITNEFYGASGVHGQPPGYFSSATRKPNVSAVVVATDTDHYRLARTAPRLWHNPFAFHALETRLPWVEYAADLESTSTRMLDATTTPAEFFALRADWPETTPT